MINRDLLGGGNGYYIEFTLPPYIPGQRLAISIFKGPISNNNLLYVLGLSSQSYRYRLQPGWNVFYLQDYYKQNLVISKYVSGIGTVEIPPSLAGQTVEEGYGIKIEGKGNAKTLINYL